MLNDIIFENQHSKKEIKQTTPKEVKTAIKNLSTGKTSDENGICSEHYKEAVHEVSLAIASIINNIFTNLDVPKSLKNGILTPVLKKKKDKTIHGNYRGIVVTSIFSKIFEFIVKGGLEYELLPSQNPLQLGFTEGASSLFAAFITTETILLYRLLQILLELVALDAEKAFETLSHTIMLNKLFHDGIDGDMWMILLRNIYQDLSLKIKWNNETSGSINILQEVRQGAKLSSLLYKRYNNTILNAISTSNLGAKLGDIRYCLIGKTIRYTSNARHYRISHQKGHG
ncbi:unnamed protein product [Mytilus coruscus]|uniref:Reverse transcriptase domain-containing protein n=1 Tax=Mytilus coruscus TaxID=42192 RepID=A0A6J8ALU9_MYTCO|nr:unnamed protein product [Mytilus coruscus]